MQDDVPQILNPSWTGPIRQRLSFISHGSIRKTEPAHAGMAITLYWCEQCQCSPPGHVAAAGNACQPQSSQMPHPRPQANDVH